LLTNLLLSGDNFMEGASGALLEMFFQMLFCAEGPKVTRGGHFAGKCGRPPRRVPAGNALVTLWPKTRALS
jgi:hypothetical protein